MSSFKLIMLTNGSSHGVKIAEALKKKNITFDTILFILPSTFKECSRLYVNLNRLNPITIIKIFKLVVIRQLKRISIKRQYLRWCKGVRFTGFLNSKDMEYILKKCEYDFLILGGCGILQKSILETAKEGVINSHPGLLPWARGTGVVGCSIQRNIAVGSTCHFVNAGIDTGNIIVQKLLNIKGDEKSLQELELMNENLAADLMVEIIEKYISKGILPPFEIQNERFAICKWVNEVERDSINKDIANGKAKELFDKWIVFCTDESLYLSPLKKITENEKTT